MDLPDRIIEAVEAALSTRVLGAAAASGGMVSDAARIDTTDGRIFAKWKFDAGARMFSCEADGLELLRSTRALRVPTPLAHNHWAADNGEPAFGYIAMEYIESVAAPRDLPDFSRRFAAGLAALHRVTDAAGQYGLEYANYLGSQPQPNRPRGTDWAAFYRDNRLFPQIERARRMGQLPPAREALVMAVVDRLPEVLTDMPPEASLIHGDLWSGNFLCAAADEEPVVIDPAVHFAPREMELAYIELFGGFPPDFVADYDAAFPLDDGYERRRPLHQLYPLLIHLNHFGERYGPAVERNCRAVISG